MKMVFFLLKMVFFPLKMVPYLLKMVPRQKFVFVVWHVATLAGLSFGCETDRLMLLSCRWSGDLRYTGWMGLSPEVWSLLMFPPMLLLSFPLLLSDRFALPPRCQALKKRPQHPGSSRVSKMTL